MHFLSSGDFDKAKAFFTSIGNIKNWQFTGPLELLESGFYKNYGPQDHPEPDAVFKSVSNAEVKWFVPADEIKDGWTPMRYQFNRNSAVVYAQNFISSPSDQTVYCNLGFTGAIKLWINDELVISEAKELTTEFDNYTVKYDLKNGTNRVLIQLSYSNLSYPCFSLRFTDEKFKPVSKLLAHLLILLIQKV